MASTTCEQNPADCLYSTFGTDPDLCEIVELFVEEMPSRIQTLVEQCNSGDWEGLRRTAHQLKGAAGSYGFEDISPAAARLERFLGGREPEKVIRNTLQQLVDICSRVRAGGPG
jgi:histidine phosphotransfer protein HptB